MTNRVLLVADDPLVRAGLAALLAEQEFLDLVGQSDVPADWDAVLAAFRPEVILWDLGWEGTRPDEELLADPGAPLVLLLPEQADAAGLLGKGVAGLLTRSAPAALIAAALQAAVEGLVVLEPVLAAAAAPSRSLPDYPTSAEPTALLTPREEEILYLLADGLTNKAIGQRLAISPHTVKFHITSILRKFDAQSRTEAVTTAARRGVLAV